MSRHEFEHERQAVSDAVRRGATSVRVEAGSSRAHHSVAQSGEAIEVRWLFGDAAIGRSDATYTATLMCVDGMGTATFRRDEDGFLGVAGSGAWRYI